jgi:hypothetical protein
MNTSLTNLSGLHRSGHHLDNARYLTYQYRSAYTSNDSLALDQRLYGELEKLQARLT